MTHLSFPAMDEVFKAVNDPSRRLLLDRLYEADGQTLGELCAHLPEMTRFGVMSHLRVLEGAGLVTTLKRGRSKLHYLNPVPIRLIHDRWISKFAEPRVAVLAATKARVEKGAAGMGSPDHIYKAFIRGSLDAVWDAITNPDQTQKYFYGTRVDSDWKPGSPITYTYAGSGELASTGEIVAVDAPQRLELIFQARWDEKLVAEGPVREVWKLAEVNGMVELAIEMYDMPATSETYQHFTEGLPYIISGLKSLVETGQGLPLPAAG